MYYIITEGLRGWPHKQVSVVTVIICCLQLKVEIGKRSGSGEAAVGSTTSGTETIDELKRAFELVEVSSPGIAEQLISRIFVRLQHR